MVASTLLARKGIPCLLIEKKNYPQHRVCGEYVSNEVVPFLKSVHLFPDEIEVAKLNRFLLTSVNGKARFLPLDLGGFGISRFSFDNFLYLRALEAGVEFMLDTQIDAIAYSDNVFTVSAVSQKFEADVVIGSFGKRSNLDIKMNRAFTSQRSPYVGVKYHIKYSHPADLVALHNFPGGYCGVSNIEDGKTNLCYLIHRDLIREHKSIKQLENNVLQVNPYLREIFQRAEFIFDKPETVNEVSFEAKDPVWQHVLMIGDAAGMITPLCGNGMAMSIHAAKIAAECVEGFVTDEMSRDQMENRYASTWKDTFRRRLFVGRQVQRLFGSSFGSSVAVNMILSVGPLARAIIRNTHGKPLA